MQATCKYTIQCMSKTSSNTRCDFSANKTKKHCNLSHKKTTAHIHRKPKYMLQFSTCYCSCKIKPNRRTNKQTIKHIPNKPKICCNLTLDYTDSSPIYGANKPSHTLTFKAKPTVPFGA